MKDDTLLQKEASMMKLDRLVAERETRSGVEFPVPLKVLLTRFEKLYTGAINDVLREFCLLDQAMPSNIIALSDGHRVAGIAFTVKSAPNCLVSGEMSFRTQMLDEMHEDAFVLWDSSGDTRATQWGGVMTATAKGKGVRAACIDGGMRDTQQVLDQNFPVYYRYRSSNGSLGRCMITHYQVPVKIGDALVKPGDVLLADLDGVVAIPRDIAYQVLQRAEEILENEKRIFGWVADGMTVQDITRNGGYF